MKSYLFEIPGEPFAKQRARTLRTGRSYTPGKTVQYENLIKICFKQKYPCETPTDDWVNVHVLAVYPVPASWTKKKKRLADSTCLFPKKHDWDNIGKIVCDGLNGVAWHDDKQIADGHVYKRFGDRPHAYVLIEVLTTEELEKAHRFMPVEDLERWMESWQG